MVSLDDPRWKTGEIVSAVKGVSCTFKGMPFWNNGIKDIRSEICQGSGYVLGRKPFDNNGAQIGADTNKQKIWVTNGFVGVYVYQNEISDNFIKGRSDSTKLAISMTMKETKISRKWVNSGTYEKMIPKTEDIPEGYTLGRLSSVMYRANANRDVLY